MNDDETMVSGAVKVSTFQLSYGFSSGSRQKVSGKNALAIDENLEKPIEFIKSCASSNLFWEFKTIQEYILSSLSMLLPLLLDKGHSKYTV